MRWVYALRIGERDLFDHEELYRNTPFHAPVGTIIRKNQSERIDLVDGIRKKIHTCMKENKPTQDIWVADFDKAVTTYCG